MTAEGKGEKKRERGLVWESEGLEEEAPFPHLHLQSTMHSHVKRSPSMCSAGGKNQALYLSAVSTSRFVAAASGSYP